MSRSGSRAAVALSAVMVLAGLARAASNDTVVLTNEQRRRGTVVQDNAEGVVIRPLTGGQLTFSLEQVDKVVYDKTPGEYDIGTRQFHRGNYDGAINFLNLALEDEHPELLKQYILYYIAKSHQKKGELKEAIAAFEGIVEQGSKSRFLLDAVESLIELHGDVGKIGKARGALKRLPRPRTRAEKLKRFMLEGMIEEKDNKHQRAMRLYGRVKNEAGIGHKDQAAKAAVGIGRCMVSLKQYDKAAKAIGKLVRERDLGDLYAAAYVILGDALVGGAKTDDDYEAAILAYLRVPALYGGDEATEAKALFEAARAYRRITGSEEAKTRAAKLFGMLRDKYPGSEYAEKAR